MCGLRLEQSHEQRTAKAKQFNETKNTQHAPVDVAALERLHPVRHLPHRHGLRLDGHHVLDGVARRARLRRVLHVPHHVLGGGVRGDDVGALGRQLLREEARVLDALEHAHEDEVLLCVCVYRGGGGC